MTHHDWLFKQLLKHFFADFLELFFPRMAAALDRRSISFLDKEIITGLFGGERHEPDLVVHARFLGKEAFCLVHSEIQGQRQEEFNRRMFDYFSLLVRKMKLPVYPIALLTYSSPMPESATFEVLFEDLDVLKFKYQVIQLPKLNWRDFMRRENPVAAALMAKMGMKPEDRPRVKLECLRMLATLRLDREKSKFIAGFVDTYLQLKPEETLIFQREADIVLGREEKEELMQIVTSWMKDGIEIGRAEGLQKGYEASQRMLGRQLQHRFGALPKSVQEQIKSLTFEQLENLGEALLEFNSIEDLEIWLAKS